MSSLGNSTTVESTTAESRAHTSSLKPTTVDSKTQKPSLSQMPTGEASELKTGMLGKTEKEQLDEMRGIAEQRNKGIGTNTEKPLDLEPGFTAFKLQTNKEDDKPLENRDAV